MKDLSIADLIALSKYCNDLLASNSLKDNDVTDYLFSIWNACDHELTLRMSEIYKSLSNNVSIT